MIEEWQDGVAIDDQPFTFAGMRHVRQLMRRDIEQFCEDRTVAGRLIQQQDKVAVFKDVLGLLGVEQVLDVLRDHRTHHGARFAESCSRKTQLRVVPCFARRTGLYLKRRI